ncbi:MAG: TonB-dependent receptor [Tannerellaceae bacterium]|jgi:outer membrane receptor protein involved in Fe transport|nr:TonB-dependent receptor [Tannerellaceae bacterium]
MPYILFYEKELRLLLSFLLLPAVAAGQDVDSLLCRELPRLEVVGKVRPSPMREGAPLQLLDRSSVERLGVNDLPEAVHRFSGVTVRDYGGIGGLKTVSIRSLGSQHTAVSYDGVTVADTQSGQVDVGRFTLDNVESLLLSIGQAGDIFQAARMYASAGALHISTRTPVFDSRPFRLEGHIKGGSFGSFAPSLSYEQQMGKAAALSFNASYLTASGEYPYTLRNGNIVSRERRHNSDIESLWTEVNIFIDRKTKGKVRLKGYWFDSLRGLPGAVILYNDYHAERLGNTNAFLQGAYNRNLGKSVALKAQGKFDYSRTRYRDFHSMYAGGQQTDAYAQQEYYTSAALLWTPESRLSFSSAADVFLNTLSATTPNCAFPTRLTSLTSMAGQYKDSRLTATASLLTTYITEEVRMGAPAPPRHRLSPAASVSFRPFAGHNLRLRASFKDALRTPTFNDLYYDRAGNKSLTPEKASQYNAGITWSGGSYGMFDYISLTADAYYNRVKDKIVAIPTMFIWRMMNMGEVDIRGLDINLSMRFSPARRMYLQVDGSYSRQRAIDVTDRESKTYGHQIPYTPLNAGTASVTFENPWVNLSWAITATGLRYALPQNMEANRIDGYTEQQIAVNRTFAVRSASLRLQAGIVNLGDVNYDVIRYYPMPGRSFRISIKYVY